LAIEFTSARRMTTDQGEVVWHIRTTSRPQMQPVAQEVPAAPGARGGMADAITGGQHWRDEPGGGANSDYSGFPYAD
jgi:hypothetical protein